jgi:hypothetical protein
MKRADMQRIINELTMQNATKDRLIERLQVMKDYYLNRTLRFEEVVRLIGQDVEAVFEAIIRTSQLRLSFKKSSVEDQKLPWGHVSLRELPLHSRDSNSTPHLRLEIPPSFKERVSP